ncbi:anaerobic ribonucleoside-triphosphate reductase activating protein [Eubacterium sp.]|uniref:anaerobic ribonucleoside-triphosphate reductase activating protein n=1 Tax=Eubacterium sp. TaxID=142586 RepID=UPI002FC9935D
MNYATIKYYDIANGPGVRTSLFVSGCTHRCPDCFNKAAWDFDYGTPFTKTVAAEIIHSLAPDYITGLTILGGEPLDPRNQPALLDLVATLSTKYPHKDIWCYTGYVYEKDLLPGGRAHSDVTDALLSHIAVLVDGPFIKEQADISLRFRGSSNQRILQLSQGRIDHDCA